jgi:hypothetical protein
LKANLEDFDPTYKKLHALSMLNSLAILSLDAAVPFFRDRLFLPSVLPDDFRLLLQRNLAGYDASRVEWDEDYRKYLVSGCLQSVVDQCGETAYRLLGQWITFSASISPIYDTFYDIQGAISDIEDGQLSLTIPFALMRFNSLRELLENRGNPSWEDALEPKALKTRWDKQFYAAHYNADPDEECNTWSPNNYIFLASTQMCCALAWGSVFNYAPTPEIKDINHWLKEISTLRELSREKNPDVQILFLPSELRDYYEKNGYFLRDSDG